MSLHPAAQQMIRKVEELSGRPVHVALDADLKVMAAITTARGSAPAHFLRYRPGTRAVDYLVAYQLGFLVRLFSCPAVARRDVVSNAAEQEAGMSGFRSSIRRWISGLICPRNMRRLARCSGMDRSGGEIHGGHEASAGCNIHRRGAE